MKQRGLEEQLFHDIFEAIQTMPVVDGLVVRVHPIDGESLLGGPTQWYPHPPDKPWSWLGRALGADWHADVSVPRGMFRIEAKK
jgi:hypothetical protein